LYVLRLMLDSASLFGLLALLLAFFDSVCHRMFHAGTSLGLGRPLPFIQNDAVALCHVLCMSCHLSMNQEALTCNWAMVRQALCESEGSPAEAGTSFHMPNKHSVLVA
jgi:hypothetical protein